jgi:MFS family permease
MGVLSRAAATVRSVISAVVVSARNPALRRAELAWGGSIAAEWAHFVALGLFAFQAGGTAAVGLAGLLRLLPAAVLTPLAGSLGDHLRRERLFLIAAGLGALALVGSALAAAAGLAVLVYALAAFVGVSTTFIRPTLSAMLPDLARSPEELVAGNGATLTLESAGTLGGPLVAGGLAAIAPIWVVFLTAAGLFALGGLAVAGVSTGAPVPATRTDWRERFNVFGRVRAITAEVPATRLVLALMITQTFVRGCLNVLIVVAAFDVLHSGAGTVGLLTAAIGVGGLLGALWAMTLHGRQLTVLFVISLILWGSPIVVLSAGPGVTLSILLLCVVGAANSVEDVSGLTLFQRAFSGPAINTMLATLWGLAMAGVAVGSAVTPAVLDAVGTRATFVAVGAVLPVVAVAGYRGMRKLDALSVPSDRLDLVNRVAIFAPLPLAAKERLAKDLVELDIPTGTSVVVAGEIGDRFYIVGSGTLQVAAGSHRATLGAGDYFGEIALLRAIPRTATVTAATECRLYALAGSDFLAAVTGHAAAEQAAREVAESRLAADRAPQATHPS